MGKVIFAFVWLLVEGMGVPLLSEGAFAPLGAAVHEGAISMTGAYLGAWAAMCVGNGIGYYLFYHYGPTLLEWLSKRWPAFHQKRTEIEPKVRVQMYPAITVSRFIGLGSFQVVLWLAGVFRAKWMVFLPYLFVLNLLWTAFWLFGSHWLVGQVLPHLEGRTWWEITLMLIVAAGLMLLLHRVGHMVQVAYKQRRRSQ